MQFTKQQLEQLCAKTCPHCGIGIPVRLRTETREWVHDSVKNEFTGKPEPGHSICWGSGIRNSEFVANE